MNNTNMYFPVFLGIFQEENTFTEGNTSNAFEFKSTIVTNLHGK